VLKPSKEAWIYEVVTDATSQEIKQGLREMNVSRFPTVFLFHLHGLKHDEYVHGRIARSLEQSSFERHRFERRYGVMKITMEKGR
jgi:hypothetical protein